MKRTIKRVMARPLALALILCLSSMTLSAQEKASPGSDLWQADARSFPTAAGRWEPAFPGIIPRAAYSAQETQAPAKRPGKFSPGRTAIITVGVFPILLFYTDIAFDSVRFAANGFDAMYAPWPFNGGQSAAVPAGERFWRLGVAAGLSLLVGIADYLLPAP